VARRGIVHRLHQLWYAPSAGASSWRSLCVAATSEHVRLSRMLVRVCVCVRGAEAVEWWHKQMDQVIDIGVDGWYQILPIPPHVSCPPTRLHADRLVRTTHAHDTYTAQEVRWHGFVI
jgi:hypothetical protein